jgi:hypothetical protein
MDQTMDALEGYLNELDQVLRAGHERYRAYEPAVLLELDRRAQAACTYCHAVAEAERRFLSRSNVRPIEVRGLKLWLLEDVNVALRSKKMDEDGTSRNYPTKQAADYDSGRELPGLPMPPVRLTAGYLLDALGTGFLRTQIARPTGTKTVMWCAAVVPEERRKAGEKVWVEVKRSMPF